MVGELDKAKQDYFKEELEKVKKQNMEIEAESNRQKERQQRLSDKSSLEKVRAKLKIIDPRSGKEIDRWTKVINDAEEALDPKQTTYNDWRSAMTSLLAMYSELNEAISLSRQEFVLLIPTPIPGMTEISLANSLQEVTTVPLSGYIKKLFQGKEKIELPDLQHNVQFENNKLKIDPLVPSDKNIKGLDTLDDLFKEGVRRWLDEQDYEPHPKDKDKFIHKHTRAELTDNGFKALQDDENTSLASFLERETGLRMMSKL